MNPIGYLNNTNSGLQGNRGLYYDYVSASNGVFIEAEGELMAARIPIADCEIRGLAEIFPKIVFRHGKIPQRFFDLALNHFLANRNREIYIAVVYDLLKKQYALHIPPQAESIDQLYNQGDQGHGCSVGVTYLNPQMVVLEMHSHGDLIAAFSSQDNKDEQGLKIYGVVGNFIQSKPIVNLRVGVYGYFMQVSWGEVFDGDLRDAMDASQIEEVSYYYGI